MAMRKTLYVVAAGAILALAVTVLAQESKKEDSNPLTKLEDAFQKAATKVKNAVVSIEVQRDPSKPEMGKEEEEKTKPVLGRKARGRPGRYYRRPKGPVSGVLISPDGYIITSYYNVRGDNIEKIYVTLPDGKRLLAERCGRDENVDTAIIKVDAKNLPCAKFATAGHLKPGYFIIVVGRGDDRLSLTVNSGIVSALNRLEGRAIQIDAALNYGNSGGAVVDIDGKLVGIACHVSNTAVTGQNSGVGFMTPPKKIQENLVFIKKGAIIKKDKKPFLGVAPSEGAEGAEGAEVAHVYPNTPAARAGIQDGDIILEFNGIKIKDWDGLRGLIGLTRVGQKVKLKVKRAGVEVELELIIGERP
jgi:S1-C subfamily serine protease